MAGPSLKIKMRSDLDGLSSAARSIEDFVAGSGVPSRACYIVGLSFEELATNIIKYGFEGDSSSREIDVEIAIERERVVLTLEDEGREFDPLSVPEPETAAALDDREIGGLGLHLVRRMAESLSYRRDGARNILKVSVKSDPEEGRP